MKRSAISVGRGPMRSMIGAGAGTGSKRFLLRHGYRYQGKSAWSAAHQRYLRELVLPHPAMKVILEEYLMAIDAARERIEGCEKAMRDLLPGWRLEPAVKALMAMKGFQTVAAMILVSELGEIHRFAHPRQVMAYLGLVPTENTSSDKRRQGGITKCGNAHARWLLIEMRAALHHPAEGFKELSKRQEGQPHEVRAISWRAQNRLHQPLHAAGWRGACNATRRWWRSPGSCAALSGNSCAPSRVTKPSHMCLKKRVAAASGRAGKLGNHGSPNPSSKGNSRALHNQNKR